MARREPTESLHRVTVRVRDLGSHAVEERAEELWVPPDDALRREALIELVERTHPGARARARSYVGGVLSFLLPGQLVVAALGKPLAVRVPREDPPLFQRDVA